jgi:hypothetical protein
MIVNTWTEVHCLAWLRSATARRARLGQGRHPRPDIYRRVLAIVLDGLRPADRVRRRCRWGR